MSRVDRVAAVIVNHRRADLLDACLASIPEAFRRAGIEPQVVVVDNGSGDGSVELVRERHPWVDVVALADNVGFPAGVNLGVSRTDAPWVLLLNNDATLHPDAMTHLLEQADAPEVGAVAAQMRFSSRPDLLNSAGIEIDVLGVAYDRFVGRPVEEAPEASEVFGASAGAALFRRAMFDELGGMDGRFFVYLEDVDLAWRARMAGWRARYAPDAVVWHHHAATASHGSPLKYFHVGRNRVRMLARNATTRHLRRHGAAMIAYDAAYVAYVAASDRTLAPLRGRLAGLREWRTYRALGARDRRPVPLAPRKGFVAAVRRRKAWARGGGAAP